jgi:hypothetical protein
MNAVTVPYRYLVSEPISAELLPSVLRAIRETYADLEAEWWIAGKLDGFDLVGLRMRSLTAFDNIDEVSLSASAPGTEADAKFEEFCRICDKRKYAATSVMWWTLQTSKPPVRTGRYWHHDLTFAFGKANDGYWAKMLVSTYSPIYTAVDRRKELFQAAVRLWGVDEQVAIEQHGRDFKMSVSPPLILRYLDNKIGNLNPTDFRISGLTSLEQLINAMRRARDELSKQVLEALFGCCPTREQYEQDYEQFNASHTGWHVHVRGTITKDAENVLNGGEITATSPTWIPAFRWYEPDDNGTVFGAVVIENGQRYLQVATDGGILEMLQDRVASLKGIQFEPVFP